MREDATKEMFEGVKVLGIPMLFTCSRIDRETVPKGLYMYEVRHDDQGDPVQIAECVLVDHFGTLITDEPIELVRSKWMNNASRDIDPCKDWIFEGTMTTLFGYMPGMTENK